MAPAGKYEWAENEMNFETCFLQNFLSCIQYPVVCVHLCQVRKEEGGSKNPLSPFFGKKRARFQENGILSRLFLSFRFFLDILDPACLASLVKANTTYVSRTTFLAVP